MSDLHIDDFCKDTAKILTCLFARFPQKSIVYVEDIAGPDSPDEFGLHSPRFMAGFNTLLWLAETDYIQYSQSIRQEALQDVTLSHRCFTYLSGPDDAALAVMLGDPPATAHTQTLHSRIDTLRHVLAHESSEQLKQLVLRFMMESRQFT